MQKSSPKDFTMSNYRVLKKYSYDYEEYSIVPFQEKDLFDIKKWRNEQLDILRQKKILTDDDQTLYFKNVINPNFDAQYPSLILFSFLVDKYCIGYGGLTNIDWESKRVELSFVLSTKRNENIELYEKEFSIFIKLIKIVTFNELRFNRIFTETYDIRPHHIAILEKNGFLFEGRMKQHVKIGQRYVDSLIHGCITKT